MSKSNDDLLTRWVQKKLAQSGIRPAPKKRKRHLVLYFAYGSNLNPEQMRTRCPTARWFGPAKLEDHRLVFRETGSAWGGGVATIEPKIGRETLGCLYVMRSDDLERLDRYEGHPMVYERILRQVRDHTGAKWKVHTYRIPPRRAKLAPPSERYLNVIENAYARLRYDTDTLFESALECLDEKKERAQ